jgi:hypothetical protein
MLRSLHVLSTVVSVIYGLFVESEQLSRYSDGLQA